MTEQVDQGVEGAHRGDVRHAPTDHPGVEGYRQALIRAENDIRNLSGALHTSRTIGTAIGILVERYDITPDVAFGYLKRISQDSNRKLRDLAGDLVRTGELLDDAADTRDDSDHG